MTILTEIVWNLAWQVTLFAGVVTLIGLVVRYRAPRLMYGLWWFHPSMWWASRQLSIQTELLCDEAVIGDLGCKPSTYARRLLNVIESAADF